MSTKSTETSDLIDVCIDYIQEKNCSYIAMTGQIVYHASPTGRLTDMVWVKLTVTECLRIIKATRLGWDKDLRDFHLIAAFQELGKVYEMAVKNRDETRPEIFNYTKEANVDFVDEMAQLLADEIYSRGLVGVIAEDYIDLLRIISKSTKVEARTALVKAMEVEGYEHRTGVKRPTLKSKGKTVCFMLEGVKPSEVNQDQDTYRDVLKTMRSKV